jgi:sulfatase maturation enzyme AslB (radical SAM superfamily)
MVGTPYRPVPHSKQIKPNDGSGLGTQHQSAKLRKQNPTKMLKLRSEPAANYRATFINGKTLRFQIDPTQPITELEYPEFYDLSFGDKCATGKCSYCYASGNPKGRHYANIVAKLKQVFSGMSPEQRPFQVAIGGQQESLEHPEFWEAVIALKSLNIVPNYTTNGVLFDQAAAELTKEHCGGLAITAHPHLERAWRQAIAVAINNKLKVNIHYIVSDSASVEKLKGLYLELAEKVDYFVLLPYMNVGFAAKQPRRIAYQELAQWINSLTKPNIAFGAHFYEFIQANPQWPIDSYPPEILSKYLVLDDPITLHTSSFEPEKQVSRAWLVN